MKTNIDNVLNDIQLHKFYENTFCALARYYNNIIFSGGCQGILSGYEG